MEKEKITNAIEYSANDAVSVLRHIFDVYGFDIIKNGKKFLSLFRDFAPTLTKETKLLMKIFDEHLENILMDILDTNGSEKGIAEMQFKEKLLNSAMLSEQAVELLLNWFNSASRKNIVSHKTYILPNGDKYEGEFSNGKFHGVGKYIWTNGTVYEGNFEDGLRIGKGKYTWIDGGCYDGIWTGEGFSGNGIRILPNGDRFEGEFIKGVLLNGNAHMTFGDGTVYDGAISNEKRIGKGKYTWTDGGYYDGIWVDESFTGNGVRAFPNGDRLEGEFINGQFIK